MTNALEFVEQIADRLRAKGRDNVKLEVTDESFGKMAWLTTIGTQGRATMNLSAFYSDRTKRWSLGELKVRPHYTKEKIRRTRTEIRIAAEVWA